MRRPFLPLPQPLLAKRCTRRKAIAATTETGVSFLRRSKRTRAEFEPLKQGEQCDGSSPGWQSVRS